MKSQFRAALLAVVVVGCLLGLAGCGGSAAKGKATATPVTKNNAGSDAGIAAGDAALAQGNRSEAGRLYLAALKSGADAATAHGRLGDLYLGSGAFPQAMDAYQQALKANGKYAPALQGIGFALYLGGNKGQAGQYLAQALALDPSLSRAAALLGTLENRDGRPEAALAVSDASLAVAFDADVENNRGISLLLLGRGEEAASAFRKAASVKKSAKFSNNLGLALCRLNRYDEAYAAFAGVATESAALNNLGVCYMEAGNKAKAQEYFEKAIAANSRFYPQAHDNLTRLSAMEEVTLPVVPQALPAAPAGQPAPAPPAQPHPAPPAKAQPAAPAPAHPAAPVPALPAAAAPVQSAAPAPVQPVAPVQMQPAAPAQSVPAQPVPVQSGAAPVPPTAGKAGQEPKPLTVQSTPAGEAAPVPAKRPATAAPSAVEKLDRSEMP
ncbi:tetratricopeptide repeat protein [Solidesulfovibrio aerotolerans]|uniref:tetratricopeptide repeat protein n=1 Tax=Solidesulfovibrio aerotolerans TaxID=295255 RepID=UPI0031B64E25